MRSVSYAIAAHTTTPSRTPDGIRGDSDDLARNGRI
jgi:hypothetical protein